MGIALNVAAIEMGYLKGASKAVENGVRRL
jgi:hypothetical protein